MVDILCNVAIGLYIFIAFAWNLPDNSVLRRMVQVIRGPILYMGLWHGWNMFAPDPLRVNRRLSAKVVLSDGSELIWRAKDLSSMNWREAFLDVRDRKWQDNVMGEQLEYLRPSLCEHLVAQLRFQGLQVDRIELIVERQSVRGPEQNGATSPPFERSVLYSYQCSTSASPRSAADRATDTIRTVRPIESRGPEQTPIAPRLEATGGSRIQAIVDSTPHQAA